MRAFVLASAPLVWVGRGVCQSAPESAEALYQRGIQAFNAGNYVVACRFLSESYRLDPQLGALFTEATCEMRAGKLATAALHYQDFITRVDSLPPEARERQQERRSVAAEQRAALLPQIPTLRIEVRGRSTTPRLTLNGNVLSEASLGIDLPVDPGDQVLEQRAASGAITIKRITLTAGEHQTLVVQLAENTTTPSPAPAEGTNGAPRSVLPYVLGGAGLLALGAGGVTGALAIGQKNIVKRECDGTSCSRQGLDAADAGKRDGLVSTIAFGIGVVALGAGIVLLATSPKERRGSSSALVLAGDRLVWRGEL
ncbi:MAG TPA: hypothetical protein VHB79_08010 [Polyangiaceae bacterium]|nr:hypothetical protein [Polyangiaceae bacterium]